MTEKKRKRTQLACQQFLPVDLIIIKIKQNDSEINKKYKEMKNGKDVALQSPRKYVKIMSTPNMCYHQ